MHEFSVVQSIVDIALESANRHHIEHVSSVEVEVGSASGVLPEAMEFAWEAAIKDTLLCNALLKIKQIPLTVKCNNCQLQYQPEEIYAVCPQCGEFNPEIITGKELKVVAIET
jgi:hydrogenase nickel incorporation protein HypA/HybF